MCYIATETIYIVVCQVVAHNTLEISASTNVVGIELRELPTSKFHLALLIVEEVLRMILHNLCTRAAVCKYEVEKDLHTERVSLRYKIFQILVCTILGVNVEVVACAVWVTRIVKA